MENDAVNNIINQIKAEQVKKLAASKPEMEHATLVKIVTQEKAVMQQRLGPLIGTFINSWLEELLEFRRKIDSGKLILPKFVANRRHKKRQSTYCLLLSDKVKLEATWEDAVLYMAEDGTIVVRAKAEFEDGRFEEIGSG